MATIVEHVNGKPVTTQVQGTPMDVHKRNCKNGMTPVSVMRTKGRYVMVEYRTATGLRTLYIWP